MMGTRSLTISHANVYHDIMAKIPLFGKRGLGKFAIVDDEDVEKVAGIRWHVNDSGYAVNRQSTKYGTLRMHRLINDTPDDMVTDHKNNNRLDNRKSNLRTVTQKENANNRKDTKGYAWDKSKQKWIVQYKRSFYGRYETEKEAQKAYQLACSGVPYVKSRRKLWHLPTGISKQFGRYRVRPQRGNEKYWLGNYDTIEEAKTALDRFNAGEPAERIFSAKERTRALARVEYDSWNAKKGRKPYRVRYIENEINRTKIFLTKEEAEEFMNNFIQEQQR